MICSPIVSLLNGSPGRTRVCRRRARPARRISAIEELYRGVLVGPVAVARQDWSDTLDVQIAQQARSTDNKLADALRRV